MKARIGSIALALAVFSVALEAQKPGVLGIGVTLGPADLPVSGDEEVPITSSLLFPMNFGAFRLEPSLGVLRLSYEEPDPFGGSDITQSFSTIAFGVGAYFTTAPADGFTLYVGPRFGFSRSSMSSEGGGDPEQTVTTTDKFIGAALGGEHFFSKHFSLGAEARLTYFMAGEPEYDPDPGFDSDFSASLTTTAGLIAARFYF